MNLWNFIWSLRSFGSLCRRFFLQRLETDIKCCCLLSYHYGCILKVRLKNIYLVPKENDLKDLNMFWLLNQFRPSFRGTLKQNHVMVLITGLGLGARHGPKDWQGRRSKVRLHFVKEVQTFPSQCGIDMSEYVLFVSDSAGAGTSTTTRIWHTHFPSHAWSWRTWYFPAEHQLFSFQTHLFLVQKFLNTLCFFVFVWRSSRLRGVHCSLDEL